MANKFIVFVVFAAAAQASLTATDLKTAEKISRTKWRQVGETICKAVRNHSWSMIGAAEAEYEKHQRAGEKEFAAAAHLADYPKILALGEAEYVASRDALFSSLKEAWKCKNYAATKAAIEKSKNSLPYETFLTAWHAVTTDKGSPTPAVTALKKVYETLFNEIEKLATSVCGRGGAIGPCPTKELHEASDALADTVYSWM